MKHPLIGLYSPVAQSGKSTVARWLKNVLDGNTLSFADAMRDAVIPIAAKFIPGGRAEVLKWLADDRKDLALIPELGVTLRHMLQTIGTDWGRNLIHPNVWVMMAREDARLIRTTSTAIIDDVRFENEYAMVQREGGILIRINRPDAPETGNTGHVSEHRLDDFVFDAIIENDGAVEDLHRKVWRALSTLDLGRGCW